MPQLVTHQLEVGGMARLAGILCASQLAVRMRLHYSSINQNRFPRDPDAAAFMNSMRGMQVLSSQSTGAVAGLPEPLS